MLVKKDLQQVVTFKGQTRKTKSGFFFSLQKTMDCEVRPYRLFYRERKNGPTRHKDFKVQNGADALQRAAIALGRPKNHIVSLCCLAVGEPRYFEIVLTTAKSSPPISTLEQEEFIRVQCRRGVDIFTIARIAAETGARTLVIVRGVSSCDACQLDCPGQRGHMATGGCLDEERDYYHEGKDLPTVPYLLESSKVGVFSQK